LSIIYTTFQLCRYGYSGISEYFSQLDDSRCLPDEASFTKQRVGTIDLTQSGVNLTWRSPVLSHLDATVMQSSAIRWIMVLPVVWTTLFIQNKDNSVIVFDLLFYVYAGTQNFQPITKEQYRFSCFSRQ